MKRVTAFVGTARKKSTYNAVRQFLYNLQSLGDVYRSILARLFCRPFKIRGRLFWKGNRFDSFFKNISSLIFVNSSKLPSFDNIIFIIEN
jgi:hypothetical protein